MNQTDQRSTKHGSASQKAESIASGLVDKAREAGKAQVQSGVDSVARGIDSVGESVRSAAETLREHDQDSIASYAANAADSLIGASDRLRNQSVDEMFKMLTRTARRNPFLFAAGSVGAGFALARLMKASAERDHRLRQAYSDRGAKGVNKEPETGDLIVPGRPARPSVDTPEPVISTPGSASWNANPAAADPATGAGLTGGKSTSLGGEGR